MCVCIDETKNSPKYVGMLLLPQRGVQSCLLCTNVLLIWLSLRGPKTPDPCAPPAIVDLVTLTGDRLHCFDKSPGTCRLPYTVQYRQTGILDRTGGEANAESHATAHTHTAEQQTTPKACCSLQNDPSGTTCNVPMSTRLI